MRRTTIALVTFLIAVPAVALIVMTNFDWNRAKPWLNERTSEALGRSFVIKGDLALTWDKQVVGPELDRGWRGMIPWPHLIAKDVHIGNPAAMMTPASEPKNPETLAAKTTSASTVIAVPEEMASIQQFAFSLDPLALLGKKIAIPVLRFDGPVVSLLRTADGKNNWTLANDDQASAWQLELQRVVFTKGSVHLIDAVKHADITADIDTINTDPAYGVSWKLHGKFNGDTVSGSGKAGAILSLKQQTTPFPVMANVRVGKTMVSVEGSITKPTDLAALDMRLKLSAPSMARLYALSGVVLPETPPFSTEGHLIGTLGKNNSHWVYEKFSGKVGSSDIGGSLDFKTRPAPDRPLLSGAIVSQLLQFSDLGALIGADSNANKTERGAAAVQPGDKVLPVETFKTERWTSIDADIQFSAEKIIREKALPINKLTTKLHLKDGVLNLSPLTFDMAGGTLSSDIHLDGSGKTDAAGGQIAANPTEEKPPTAKALKATMKVSARHLKLKQLFPTLDALQASVGEINGDASLSATGNSIASLLAASNGEVKTLINQGSISKRLLEQMGLNIGNVALTYLSGDKQVKLNCMATDFAVTNGVMQTRTFIVDTDDAVLDVSGNVNMAQEQLDLTIKPNSKGLRVFSLRAPLYVQGSFKDPKVSVDKGVLALRAGGAIALAVAAPVAALLPLINAGPEADSGCAKLLAEARVTPVAPAPGKTYKAKAVAK